MTKDDVRLTALRTALADMPAEFRTKDLSNHPAMTSAHARWLTDKQYHRSVGEALSLHQVVLGIKLLEQADGNNRGALWQRKILSKSG